MVLCLIYYAMQMQNKFIFFSPSSMLKLETTVCMFLVLAVPSYLYLCDQCGASGVQMCPAVGTQWTTPLIKYIVFF